MPNAPAAAPRLLRRLARRLATALLAAALGVTAWSAYALVAPGYTGVVFNVWTGSLRTVPQGLCWRIPWVTQVQSYPTALRTYTMALRGAAAAANDDSIDLPTREGQHIRQDISVTFNTSERQAAEVFRSFRGADIAEIESTFIRRTIITVAQNVAGRMSLSEVISSQRNELQQQITALLADELGKMGFNTDKVNLGASHLPAALEAQMQQKMAAQQQAQQAEYELQKQQMLAKAAVATAEGQAQAVLVRARAEAEANALLHATLSGPVLQNKAIDRWDGSLPQVSGQASPLVELGALGGRGATGGRGTAP